MLTGLITMEKLKANETLVSNSQNYAYLSHPKYTDVAIDTDATISQLLSALQSKGCTLSTPCLTLDLVNIL